MLRQKSNRNGSIFTKISAYTIILIILSSIASCTFMLVHFSSNIKDKERLLVREAAERIEQFMLDQYNVMYNQRILMHSTGHVAHIISSTRENPTEIYQAQNVTKITSYLTALCYSDPTILDAILLTSDGKHAFSYSNTSDRNIPHSFDYTSLPYIADFSSSPEAINTIYDEAPPYLPDSGNKKQGVITFVGKLYDMRSPTKQIIIGYLLINISPDEITAAYNEIDNASDGEHIVVNGNSKIIYSNIPGYVNQTYREDFLPKENILLNNKLSLSGLKIVSAVSDEELLKDIRGIIIQIIMVTAASILCLTIIVTVMHEYYKRRFDQMASAMHLISQGDFATRLNVTSNDEIGYLSRSFNTMCETLDSHIRKTYLAETQRRTAELYALQAQINPHFLANTLESIRMRALQDNHYELAEMLSNLGTLFRWMIDFNQDIVYVEDEIDYIESYLDLQKFRFGDRLRIKLNVPTDILYFGIPRFTIQPLVENTLTHGFHGNGQTLEIKISLLREDDILKLTVTDNGNGIPETALNSLKDHIYGVHPQASYGVALKNVHTRIRLLFGEKYGLAIDSRLYLGTTVVVTLPALPKEEMDKYV